MILEAKYVGPFPTVTIPSMPGVIIKQGEVTKIRIPDGVPIAECWEIVKGKKEYEAGLKAAAEKKEQAAKATTARAAATKKLADENLKRASGMAAEPEPGKEGD